MKKIILVSVLLLVSVFINDADAYRRKGSTNRSHSSSSSSSYHTPKVRAAKNYSTPSTSATTKNTKSTKAKRCVGNGGGGQLNNQSETATPVDTLNNPPMK